MKKHRSGVIINISSVTAIRASKLTPAYGASKSALVGLITSVVKAVASDNIRVIAICPGPIKSEKWDKMDEKSKSDFNTMMEQQIPMQRAGTLHEIAGTIVWLCSDSAGYITGIALPIDGGYST